MSRLTTDRPARPLYEAGRQAERLTTVVNSRREPCDVYIGAGSEWENPFRAPEHGDRDEVLKRFARLIERDRNGFVERIRAELRGKTLGCPCPQRACHGEVLARIANEDDSEVSS